MTEKITLRRRNGVAGPADAEVRRTTPLGRTVRAFGIFFASVLLGLPTVVIPGAHFILPWAIPLTGGLIAAYVFGKEGDVDSVRGACPECQAVVDLPGGPIEASMWRKCPACGVPLQIEVPKG